MYTDTFIDEVRQTASIVETVGAYVNLRKRGRNHQGLCPFHSEKTPSFHVSDERQWYHCFGCGASGDIFKFLSLVESLNFPEAVRWVAEKYGIPIPERVAPDPEVHRNREEILQAIQAAERFYIQMLEVHSGGQQARDYLRQRGFRDKTIEDFSMGFAPGGGGLLLTELEKQGFSPALLEKAGLVKKSEAGRGYYDYFRKRILFPIKDLSGTTIAFGGRVLDDGVPKYLNSPESSVYAKGRNLFSLNFAKESIRKLDHVILVEGYLDCLIPFQEGIENVVASLGTSLTRSQAKVLARYTRNIVVNYDPDPAGINATRRSVELLLEEGFRINVLQLPGGQDPDSFIRGSGVDEYRRLLRHSIPYLDFVTDEAVRQEGSGSSGRSKVKVLNVILPFLAKVPNRIERLEYVTRIGRRLQVEDEVVLSELTKAAKSRSHSLKAETVAVLPEILQAEKDLIRMMLGDQDLARAMIPLIDSKGLEGLRTSNILRCICEIYEAGGQVDFSAIERRLTGSEDMSLLSQIYFEKNLPSIEVKDAVNSLNALKRLQLTRRMKKLQLEIERARVDKDEKKIETLYHQKIEIGRLINTL